MNHALRVRGLRKTLDPGPAVLDGVDLDLAAGSLVAVRCGRVAASALVRCLSGAYRPDAGTVTLARGGEQLELTTADPRDIAWVRRHHLAVLDGAAATSPSQAADAVVARLAGCPTEAARAALDRLGAGDLVARRYGTLRPAQRRLVALTSALAGRAQLILLDVPEEIVDPARAAAWLHERRQAGAAVLVTAPAASPITADASATGDLHEGKLRWVA